MVSIDKAAFPLAVESASAPMAAIAREAPLAPTFAIELEGFSFAYGDKPTIGPFSWQVPQGSLTLLDGATGSGKTTLLRNLKSELVPAGEVTGQVRLFGKPISEFDTLASAETVGYVAQNPDSQIVCDSVWHELAFGLENLGTPQVKMHRRIAEVAHFFGIEPWLDSSANELSGGQKQLLCLASILALRPKILLLDEPTSQLDPVAAKDFLHALFRINRELGLTVVVVTHEPELVAPYATDYAVLKDGRVEQHDIAQLQHDTIARAQSVDYYAPGVCAEPMAAEAPVEVSLSDVYVRYKREMPFVLRGCDFALSQGSIHALVGGNGSGKSTLLLTIANALSAERGLVRNNHACSQAYLPQNPKALFVCDTVAQELSEWQDACGYSDEDIAKTAKQFRIDAVLDQHPYDLSGGQQQLLAFAKIMLTKPALFLMDEPTKGLDVLSKCVVADALCRAKQEGMTALLATHDLAFAARVADATSMLFDGRVACTQPTGLFFEENLFYRPTYDWFFTTWVRPECLHVIDGESSA